MHEPQDQPQREIIYVPPAPEVIEKYARDVCEALEQRYGGNHTKSEVITGFTAFLKEATKIYANHLTRKHKEQRAMSEEQKNVT